VTFNIEAATRDPRSRSLGGGQAVHEADHGYCPPVSGATRVARNPTPVAYG